MRQPVTLEPWLKPGCTCPRSCWPSPQCPTTTRILLLQHSQPIHTLAQKGDEHSEGAHSSWSCHFDSFLYLVSSCLPSWYCIDALLLLLLGFLNSSWYYSFIIIKDGLFPVHFFSQPRTPASPWQSRRDQWLRWVPTKTVKSWNNKTFRVTWPHAVSVRALDQKETETSSQTAKSASKAMLFPFPGASVKTTLGQMTFVPVWNRKEKCHKSLEWLNAEQCNFFFRIFFPGRGISD